MQMVPSSLRTWFMLHFIVDMLFALPLLFAPAWTFTLLGIAAEGTITARLVGAALIGIGGNSLLMHKEGIDAYRSMLNLKALWSAAAVLGLALEFYLHPSPVILAVLLIFIGFAAVWNFYRWQLSS